MNFITSLQSTEIPILTAFILHPFLFKSPSHWSSFFFFLFVVENIFSCNIFWPLFPLPISSQILLISPPTQHHNFFLALEDKQKSKSKHSRIQTKPNQMKQRKRHKNYMHMDTKVYRETPAILLNHEAWLWMLFVPPHNIETASQGASNASCRIDYNLLYRSRNHFANYKVLYKWACCHNFMALFYSLPQIYPKG